MVCHGLWNSTGRVVGYNAKHLGLDARLSVSEITRTGGRWQFHFGNGAGETLAEGDLAITARQSPAAMWQLLRHVGLRGSLQLMRSPFIHVPVVNIRSPYAAENLVAHTYTRSDNQVIRRFGLQDRLVIRHPLYAPLGFTPDFVQQVDGVRFVYLRPQPEGA